MQYCGLLCLQDTNFACFRDVADFEARFSVTAFFSYAPRRATGVGVVVCNRSLLRNATYLFDTERRTVRFDFFFGERKFRLVTVYAPTVSTFQHDYVRSLDVHLLDAGPCFLVGDFNCVLDSYADVRGPEEISDHRPLLIKLCFDSAVARSSRPGRLDSRILHDEATRRTLGNLVKESLVGVRPEPASWDRLKGQWQSSSTLMGRQLRERHRGLLQDTILGIRIVRRGGALSPFMRAYLDQLQRRYERYLRLDSTASTVLQAQGCPSVHPQVLRYTHRTSLQAFERQQTPSASESPGRLDNGRFAAHFRSLAQSDAPIDRTSVSSHPLLSGLPKISAEDYAGLRRPPSATELWNVLKRMKDRLHQGRTVSQGVLPHVLAHYRELLYRCRAAWSPFRLESTGTPSISGLALPGSGELGVSAYVDDMTLYLRDEDSLVKALRLFDDALGAVYLLLEQPHGTSEVLRLCLHRCEGGWSFPCIELAAPILALKTTLAILDDHDNPAGPLTLYFLGANNRLLGDSLPSPLRPRAETTPAFYKSTADLFDKLSVHVSREEACKKLQKLCPVDVTQVRVLLRACVKKLPSKLV
ncbi:hypothetical protein HPB47_016024 [Ixodes persulcatus]|uniref:Uncharacterized protein n=1 Tax=Ixodes persulcatus TaxID=34615 RepID=A0AC60QRX3_IXOPE|nr:hypothetical protein HPB47_016024 [Ixodes persulcatus]